MKLLYDDVSKALKPLFSDATFFTNPNVEGIRIRGSLAKSLVVYTSATSKDPKAVKINPLTKSCLQYAVKFVNLPKNEDKMLDLFIDLREHALTGKLDYDTILAELANFSTEVATHGLHIFHP